MTVSGPDPPRARGPGGTRDWGGDPAVPRSGSAPPQLLPVVCVGCVGPRQAYHER